MDINPAQWLGSSALWVTCFVNALSLFVVWLPLRRGLALYSRARRATRQVPVEAIRATLDGEPVSAAVDESLALLYAGVLAESLADNAEAQHPTAFLRDAARQYTENEYAASFTQPLSMYANILPPIGFIGTTAGLMVLFASMHLSNETLELSGLALALSSTLFALIGYASLEGLKIRLYRRFLDCLDAALGPCRAGNSSSASSALPASAVAPATSPART